MSFRSALSRGLPPRRLGRLGAKAADTLFAVDGGASCPALVESLAR